MCTFFSPSRFSTGGWSGRHNIDRHQPVTTIILCHVGCQWKRDGHCQHTFKTPCSLTSWRLNHLCSHAVMQSCTRIFCSSTDVGPFNAHSVSHYCSLCSHCSVQRTTHVAPAAQTPFRPPDFTLIGIIRNNIRCTRPENAQAGGSVDP